MVLAATLILDAAPDKSNTFVAAWLPGTKGLVMTDVLCGDAKFKGKLPSIWPRSNAHVATGNMPEVPLFHHGY